MTPSNPSDHDEGGRPPHGGGRAAGEGPAPGGEARHPQEAPSGLRGRFRRPAPPAPVPEPRPSRASRAPEGEDRSKLTLAPGEPAEPARSPRPPAERSASQKQPRPAATKVAAGERDSAEPADDSDEEVVRETGSMAVATLISRITGFLRTVLIGSALGEAVGSAFNTANTLPNLITEIVLGAVLTSLVVPVLVRAQKEDPDRGEAFVRRLFTLAFSLLAVVTVAAVILAPWITRLTLDSEGLVNVTQATSFAYLVLPQILFYGLFSLFMAVLNTRGVFKPGTWAPVANNVVSILVLSLYLALPGELHPAAPSRISDPHVLLLGVGTTLGVVVQLLIMVPYLRRLGINLKPLWGLDERLKQFGGMALAIIVYVAISQAGYIITTRIASLSDAAAPLVYQNHWLLLQVPYGVVGVTLLTAIMPRLSRNAADGDDNAVVGDLTMATQLTFIALIPVIIFFTAFGTETATALFQYGNLSPRATELIGLTLSFSAFTLIPYALVLLHLRVFYAREEAWTPTFIIAGITATKTVLSLLAPLVASSPDRVVILLGAANGFGFVAGAVIGAFLLHRKLGSLQARAVMRTSLWAVAASLIGVAAALTLEFVVQRLTGGSFASTGEDANPLLTVLLLGALGLVFVVVTGIVLSFSKLPEVQNLGVVLQRIPGLSRIIRPDTERQIMVERPTAAELSGQYIVNDSFQASPVPPPMSAGVVRGPRLVPGAPVSDGKYRLLSDQGSVPGARFWQAREQSSGRLVALTFVDTSGSAPMAPPSPVEVARHAARVTRRTRQLARLNHEAIAPNIEVSAYRSGCLVVSDWVSGSSLQSVAHSSESVNPRAAAYALASLTDAVGAAHDRGTPLGLDNWARIRITTNGRAVLAFPAVLDDSDYPMDLDAIASALNLLIDEDFAPQDVCDAKAAVEALASDAREVPDSEESSGKHDETEGEETAYTLARRLRAAGLGGDEQAEPPAGDDEPETPEPGAPGSPRPAGERPDPSSLLVERDAAPEVEDRGGFGNRGLTRRGTGVLAAFVFVAVVGVAAAATYLVATLSSGDDNAPVNSRSLQREEQPSQQPVIQPLQNISVWGPEGRDVSGDNPADVANVVDSDSETEWNSAPYPDGEIPGGGIGLALEIQGRVALHELILDVVHPNTPVEVYALTEGQSPAEVANVGELEQLYAGELNSGRSTISLDEGGAEPPVVTGVILWFPATPSDADSVGLRQARIVGTGAPREAGFATPPAEPPQEG